MAGTVKNALITSFLSRTHDRFHEYHAVRTLEERLETASRIEGITGVEIVHHYEADDPGALRALLSKYKLGVAAINANVKAEPDFRDGGLTSVDAAVRAKAVGLIKRAKEFAKAVRADKVTCCPLGDGYEFNFHCDYARMWRFLVEGFGEAAEYLPEVPLFVEYKPSETRARCFVDTAAKALCLIQDIQSSHMGVTIDFGHSLYAQENPAEAFSMVVSRGQRAYVHINDNDGRWDWDLIAGSRHFIDYVEFLFYLMEHGYDDYLTSDTSPTRLAIEGILRPTPASPPGCGSGCRRSIATVRRLVARRDYLETWQFIEEHILRLTGPGGTT